MSANIPDDLFKIFRGSELLARFILESMEKITKNKNLDVKRDLDRPE